MGVKTITLTEPKGALAGALVVREHQELVFISQNGMVQRTGVRGINRYGRASQGVQVMNMREDDVVSRGRAGRRDRGATTASPRRAGRGDARARPSADGAVGPDGDEASTAPRSSDESRRRPREAERAPAVRRRE